MKVEDFKDSVEVQNETELVSFLARRFRSGANSFWLSRNKYPGISILVNGDLASLTYFPKKRHPGFKSVGNIKSLKPGEMTIFYLDNVHQQQPMINDSVISFQTALQVAKDFYESNTIPASIKWLEL